jgi:hypothetical protein
MIKKYDIKLVERKNFESFFGNRFLIFQERKRVEVKCTVSYFNFPKITLHVVTLYDDKNIPSMQV